MATGDLSERTRRQDVLVISASSLGTVFEWYDFYLYGLLAAILAEQFFSGVDQTTGFIFALAAFAAGFAVRPFGALVFGRLGDLVGRKYTFLVTMGLMGLSTFIVGLLPSYASAGILAPILLIGLRLIQGLALGGEYGGAATYVAEHAPEGRRGFYTSWIQTTATLGLFAALAGGDWHAHNARRGGIQGMGMAAALPALDLPARHLAVDPPPARRKPGVRSDEGGRDAVEGADPRSIRQSGRTPGSS